MKTMGYEEFKRKYWREALEECPLCQEKFDGANAVEVWEGKDVCVDCYDMLQNHFKEKRGE